MNYLKLTPILGFVSSCFCYAKDGYVVLNTTRTKYSVGDSVELICYVRSDKLTVSFGRNNSDLGICSTIINGCASKDDIREKHGNYELKLVKSHPMLVIKNVTRDDAGADFTCRWNSYLATISFSVIDEHVQFEATRTIYNVGDTVTLTCYVTSSSWLTVSFARNNSDLGNCYTILNGCVSAADIQDKHGTYELKLVKSYPMLVIKNVTRDDAGAYFTCQWTSYSDTVSFAVTDENVEFTATRRTYNVGDTVVLTCYVRSSWSTVLFTRNKSDLGHCSTIGNECMSADNMQDQHGNYEIKLEKSRAMLVIKNVTRGDDGAEFTCHWTSLSATLSFAVTDENVEFKAARRTYNVGDTAVLTCYVRSSWSTVLFTRNNSDLGHCSTIVNGCMSADNMRDKNGNYELKLEKSRPMLVINNVTRGDDGAEFTCHLTSYTATVSFAVTDIAVATPRMPRDMTFMIVYGIEITSCIAVLTISAYIIWIRHGRKSQYLMLQFGDNIDGINEDNTLDKSMSSTVNTNGKLQRSF